MAFIEKENATPRDLARYNTSLDVSAPLAPSLWRDYRLQGWPDSDFHQAKVPRIKQDSAFGTREAVERYFGKTSFFDKGSVPSVYNQQTAEPLKPRVAQTAPPRQASPAKPKLDEGHKGLQYLSEETARQIKSPAARPIRDTLGQKTSADIRKIHNQQHIAEADIARHKFEQKVRMEDRQEEQKEPGDNRMMKFQETDVPQRGGLSYREPPSRDQSRQSQQPEYNYGYASPGGGGQQEQQRGEVDRYRYNNYSPREQEHSRQEMDRQYEHKRLEDQEVRIQEKRREIERVKMMALKDDSKRNESDSFNDRRETMSLDLANDPRRFPMSPRRAPLYQSQDYDDDIGKPTPRFKKVNTEKPDIYDPFGKQGGGAPNRDFHGKVNSKVFGRIEHEPIERQLISDDKRFYNARNSTQKVMAARQYLNELQDEMEQTKRQREYQDKQMKEPITGANRKAYKDEMGELAPIVQATQVGKPKRDPRTGLLLNHHLGSSDVSKMKNNYQPKTQVEKQIYHEELAELAESRHRRNQLNRLQNNQEGLQHYDTMDEYWGRPGGGAPKGPSNQLKKANLENILFQPKTGFNPATEEYVRKKDWSQQEVKETEPEHYFNKENKGLIRSQLYENRDKDSYPKTEPYKYVRSTVASKHSNQYEYAADKPLVTEKNHRIEAPYGLHSYATY